MKLPADIVARLRERFDGLRVCVTGGAGFIGGHLVDALVSVGAVVTVIDDLSSSSLAHLGELIDLDPERVRFVHGSILDDDALADAIGAPSSPSAVDTVFHLAAVGSVPLSIREPQRTWSVNATGTVRVLEAARRAGVRRVVFAASSSAYGGLSAEPPPSVNGSGHERPVAAAVETAPPSPLSPYAASKLAGEAALAGWARSYGMSTVSLRFFNIFGPRQSADSAYAAVIAAFAKRLLAAEPPIIYGDGRQTRDFTHVSNAVLACLLAAATDNPLRGEVINVGTGRRIDLLGLLAAMQRAAGILPSAASPPRFEPARAGDVRHSLADISRARDLLGYEPVVSLEDGLADTMAWYRSALSETR